MHRTFICVLGAALLAPAMLCAQEATTEGTLTVGVGGALQEGNRPAFQRLFQHKKTGYGGIEEYRLTRETEDAVLTFDARLLPSDENYKLAVRYEKTDRYYVDAGFEQFKVWYDGNGGYFAPKDLFMQPHDEDLALKRGKIWFEAGVYLPNQTLLKAGFQRLSRDGTKNSTMWADTNLVGAPYGTRNIVPSFYDLDEVTNIFTFDASNTTGENAKWAVGARYAETELDDKRWSQRRPLESADRQITTKDETTTDMFTVHGFYERKINERLTVSGGALRTTLDSHISGSRIYGQSYDPVYDPAYVRRQQRDEGFYDLEGEADLKQTVLNLNAVYAPHKHVTITPSLRFENLHQESMAEYAETNVVAGTGGALVADIHDMVSANHKKWDDLTGEIESRYTGVPNWVFSAAAEWNRGSGTLGEEMENHHTGAFTINRDLELERTSQKYSANANWYTKPGLTFAGQYYFKVNMNDYDALLDNTVSSSDRYPAYITDQDFETHDFNVRMTWRPVTLVNLVTRYDYQQSTIVSQQTGLEKAENAEITSHIVSQSVTLTPTTRLFLTGNVNVTFDQMKTPAQQFVKHGDNNYLNGSVGGGYAVSNKDDVYLDYAFFRAKNFVDDSATSLPFGLDQRTTGTYVTWNRRHAENLIYTIKYGYVQNRDGTYGGRNDFDAHVIYGRVQYKF